LAADEEGDDVVLAIDVVPAVVGAAEDADVFLVAAAVVGAAEDADVFLAAAFAVTGELVVAALVAEEALYEGSRSHL
jgi:hypothetical protein